MKPSAREFLGSLDSPSFLKVIVLISAIVSSAYSIVRFLGLQTYAWDTGTYSQAVYSTVFQGRWFFYTADLPANPTGSLLGVHFSPILILLAPFYFLYPSSITLLVAQSVALTLGAIPLYKYALNRLDSRRSASVITLCYLLSPAIVGVDWYGFHPEAFLVPALIGAIYFAHREKWLPYILLSIVALATIETAPVIVASLAAFVAWKQRSKIRDALGLHQFSSATVLVPLSTVIISIVWLVAALEVIRTFNPINPFYFGTSPLYWTVLGARNIQDVPFKVLTNPGDAFAALSYDWKPKTIYIVALLGPVLFLSLRSPSLTLLTMPWLGVSLLSNFPPFYQDFYQYPAFVAPFIFLGAVEGYKKVAGWKRIGRLGDPRNLRKALIVSSIISFVVLTPVLPWVFGFSSVQLPYGVFSANSRETAVSQLVAMVPPSASVLASTTIFPLVSSRTNAYVVPTSALFPPGTSFNGTLDGWLKSSDYIILDYYSDTTSTLLALQRMSVVQAHGLYAEVQSVMLYKRDYSGPLVKFSQTSFSFDYHSLSTTGDVVADPNSNSGRAISTKPGQVTSILSAEEWLPPGMYTTTFSVRYGSEWSGNTTLSVIREPLAIISSPVGSDSTGYNYGFTVVPLRGLTTNLPASTSQDSSGYFTVKYSFQTDGLSMFRFGAQFAAGSTGAAYLDQITITQVGQ